MTAFCLTELSAASKTLLPRNALQADAAYYGGALVREGEAKHSPVGKMFIQPKVTLENGDVTLLDNAIGANFGDWLGNAIHCGDERRAKSSGGARWAHASFGGAGSANSYRQG